MKNTQFIFCIFCFLNSSMVHSQILSSENKELNSLVVAWEDANFAGSNPLSDSTLNADQKLFKSVIIEEDYYQDVKFYGVNPNNFLVRKRGRELGVEKVPKLMLLKDLPPNSLHLLVISGFEWKKLASDSTILKINLSFRYDIYSFKSKGVFSSGEFDKTFHYPLNAESETKNEILKLFFVSKFQDIKPNRSVLLPKYEIVHNPQDGLIVSLFSSLAVENHLEKVSENTKTIGEHFEGRYGKSIGAEIKINSTWSLGYNFCFSKLNGRKNTEKYYISTLNSYGPVKQYYPENRENNDLEITSHEFLASYRSQLNLSFPAHFLMQTSLSINNLIEKNSDYSIDYKQSIGFGVRAGLEYQDDLSPFAFFMLLGFSHRAVEQKAELINDHYLDLKDPIDYNDLVLDIRIGASISIPVFKYN